MRVKEWKGDVVFLHEVAPGRRPLLRHPGGEAGGPARRRVKRAETVLKAPGKGLRAAASTLIDDLPLFSAAAEKADAGRPLRPRPPSNGLKAAQPRTR